VRHCTEATELRNEPSGQADRHWELSGDANRPNGHVWQTAELLAPRAALKAPGEQRWQVVLFSAAKLPAAHSTGAAAGELQNAPGGQG
jgi:hypothetical protein